MPGVGAGTLALQASLVPRALDLMARYGHDLLIVFPPSRAVGDDGLELLGAASSTQVRGYLYPMSDAERAKRGAEGVGGAIAIPGWTVLLPYAAPVNMPGWWLQHAGRDYYPSGDAQDLGHQQICWKVELTSPEARS